MLSDLPVVLAALAACVWVARGTRWAAAIECALPMLALALIAVPDERMRFFACGVIAAAAFAGAALVAGDNPLLVVAGVALLRWIPVREVEVWRELVVLVVLAGALALSFAERRRPTGWPGAVSAPTLPRRRDAAEPAAGTAALRLVATLAVAAVTPVHPGKAALFPLVLAGICVAAGFSRPYGRFGRLKPAATPAALAAAFAVSAFFVRWSIVPILVTAAFALLVPYMSKLRPLAYAAALALFAMWPWSGVVARALPAFARYEPAAGEVRGVGWALGRGEGMTLPVGRLTYLTVIASAANAAGMPPGRVVGFVDAGGCTRAVRIGDVADFGFTRRPHFFAARNPLPRVTRADIRGYGATSWLHGAGAIGVACQGRAFTSVRFRGADDLPPDARLQIESVELPPR